MATFMSQQRQDEAGLWVHEDAPIAHVHHDDEIENLGVEALADAEIGDREGQMIDPSETGHRASVSPHASVGARPERRHLRGANPGQCLGYAGLHRGARPTRPRRPG